MSNPDTIILGRAIFGTTQGLTAQGDGVLASLKNRVSILEFESGRQHGGILHHVPTDDPLLFVRRIADNSGREVNLVGLVAPCRDQLDRNGFFGSCVAIPIDRTSPKVAYFDWFVLLEPLFELYTEALSLYDEKSKRLRWRNLLPTTSDRVYEWEKLDGNSVNLFFNKQSEEDDQEILSRLQALTFMHGHSITTITVSMFELPGSKPLDGEVSDKALRSFAEVRKAGLAAIKPKPKPTGAEASRTTDEMIELLWSEIVRLSDEVQKLKAYLIVESKDEAQRGTFDQAFRNSVFAGDQNGDAYTRWAKLAIIGFAALLALALAGGLIFYMFSGNSLSEADTTRGTGEVGATVIDERPTSDPQEPPPGE